MLTEQESIDIKRAVRRLVRAEVDMSWKGSQDPIYHKDIEADLRSAKAMLASLLSVKTQKRTAPEIVRLVDDESQS